MLGMIGAIGAVMDSQLRKQAYFDEDETYVYMYHCFAEPDTLLTESKWRVKKIIYKKTLDGANDEYFGEQYPINPSTLEGTNEFIFLATSLAVVKALSYRNN